MDNNNPQHLHISDFNYPLTDERIAKYPLAQRDLSKLLIYRHGEISQDTFVNLPDYLPSGALMVFNNTKVIRARLHFRKSPSHDGTQGALIEIFLLEPAFPQEYQENFTQREKCTWHCLVGNSKKWKSGSLFHDIEINGRTIHFSATRIGIHGTSQEVMFEWDGEVSFSEVLEAMGELPIPPYLNRKTEDSDLRTYQTVYSKIKGSVAAPTAGLHFTPRVLQDIDAHGIERQEVTLHVGAGTFKPVKAEEIGGHEMHTEHIAVHRSTIESLLRHDAKAIAVGTTSVRTLESLYYMGVLSSGTASKAGTGHGDGLHVPQWFAYEYDSLARRMSAKEALEALLCYMDANSLEVLHSSTQIIIAPGYEYKIVNMMLTNFHQPQSTLLLLVSAFVKGDWRSIYDYALNHDFRFLSYGDSSLLIP